MLLAAALSAAPAAPPPHGSCADLAAIALPDTTIRSAEEVAGPSFAPPGSPPLANVPAFCRIAAVTKPAVNFEVWLPLTTWNGKFQGAGNGANAGSISYAAMAVALRRGYASASTDTGHATRNGRDGAWALGHPELVVDFGYRALHVTTENAKKIVEAFLSSAAEAFVLRLVLDRRPPGTDGGTEISPGLRRHHRRRSCGELDAFPDRRPSVDRARAEQGPGELYPLEQAGAAEQRCQRRLRHD